MSDSDLSFDDMVFKRQHKEKDPRLPEPGAEGVLLPDGDGFVKIIVRSGGSTSEVTVNTEVSLSSQIGPKNIKYHIEHGGAIVSNYASLTDLGSAVDLRSPFVVRVDDENFTVTVNYDHGEHVEIPVSDGAIVKDMVDMIPDERKVDDAVFVMNGLVLDENALVRDVLNAGDTVDYVHKWL